jgi:hypothetical protein
LFYLDTNAKKRRRVEENQSQTVHVPFDSLDKYGYHFKSKLKKEDLQ